ncbi:conserved hypothetical protein [Echinococcus multilocularis]|uniref:Inner centromere protein ARK-binding domain-containing protein n=1 Tax=Echinococcus multilocularis TaxID=6211 RepID=A0A068Y4H1_ECHMU|nr:conserved hypothetical protein [Echinococcus multilocularis]
MDVEESSGQLLLKIETLSSDLDSLASKAISKLCHRIQVLVPDFVLPDTLELINSKHVFPKPRKRKFQTSRSTTRSRACNTKSKRRKLTVSLSSIEVSERTQSFAPSDVEMCIVPEERSQSPVTPLLDSVYSGLTKGSRSTTEIKPVQGDATGDETLVAENTTEAATSVQRTTSKGRKSAVRSPSEPELRSPSPSKRCRFGSPVGDEEPLSTVATKRKSRESSSNLAKTARFAQPLTVQESRTTLDKSSESSIAAATNEDALKVSYGNSSIMTEESDDTVGVVEVQAPKSSAHPPKISTSAVDVAADDAVTSTVTSTSVVFVKPVSQNASTPAASVPTESRLGRYRNTPWPIGLSKPWLSRLGWGTASKTPSTTANTTNMVTVTNMTNSNLSHQLQPSRLSARASVGMGKLKSVTVSTAPSLVKHAKPPSVVTDSAPRLPMQSQLNKVSCASKAKFSVIGEKEISINHRSSSSMAASVLSRRAATGPLQTQLTTKLLPRDVAEDDRRTRAMADLTAKEQRHREFMEKRALERKAKVKAANEHRMAVRANAEREAKEKQAAATRRMEAERLRLQKIAIKVKIPPPKTAAIASHQRTSQSVKQLPFSSASANTAAAAFTTATTKSANYMKNFDLAKVAPPLPPHATAVNKSQALSSPPSAKMSPLSYDLTGLLSDHDSESDNEKQHKKRYIPSWAKNGSKELFSLVSRVYRGEVRWQEIFRPADKVHFEDAELFHGYKFRTRPRGSSAVWNSPTSTRPNIAL